MLVEFILQFGLLGDKGVEVCIGFGEFGVDLIEAREHFDDGSDRLFHNLDHCFCFIKFWFLFEKPNRVALRRGDLADVFIINARHNAQQRGLARAVETEHADLRAIIETKRNIAQDHFVTGWDETSHFVHGVDYE